MVAEKRKGASHSQMMNLKRAFSSKKPPTTQLRHGTGRKASSSMPFVLLIHRRLKRCTHTAVALRRDVLGRDVPKESTPRSLPRHRIVKDFCSFKTVVHVLPISAEQSIINANVMGSSKSI